MKSSRLILRRLVRNIGAMYSKSLHGLQFYFAKPSECGASSHLFLQVGARLAESDASTRRTSKALCVPAVVAITVTLYDSRMYKQFRCLALLFVIGITTSALADEGMWLFNAPPLKQLKEKYQFQPSPQWLEHLQKASVRFNSGGSGSFVSPNGLVITNHHVGADTLQKMGDTQHNYLRYGFYAK